MPGTRVPINFTVGSRRILSVRRQLQVVRFGLADLLSRRTPALPPEEPGCDGYRVLSAPAAAFDALLRARPNHVPGGLNRYERFHIDMTGSFEDYMAHFSSRTRSTLKRKQRKIAELAGGEPDIREFSAAADIPAFLADALPLSRRTYQARLLGAGLPEGEEAARDMATRAGAGQLRAYILYLAGKPAAYLHLPIEDGVIIYAHLGYDPDHAALSPGTVLQLEALRRLFAEQRFTHFDFTEGEGDHKRLFATRSVQACSFYLLRPRLGNQALMAALDGFDRSVAATRRIAARGGVLSTMRQLLRG